MALEPFLIQIRATGVDSNSPQELLMKNEALDNRFEFGKNWRNFLRVLDNERIDRAQESLQSMLQIDRLDGKRFRFWTTNT